MLGTQLLPIFFLFCVLLAGCRFNVSPYSGATSNFKMNENNLNRIRTQEPGVPTTFKVALISDTHNYYDQLDKLISKLNQNGPYAFVIVTGDITNYGLIEEYHQTRRLLNRLHYPYLVVVGNHDLLGNGSDIYKKMFGPMDFDLVYKNVHFIFFNNNNWEAHGRVPDIIWVEGKLASSSSPHRVLVAHVSPSDPERFMADEITAWENLVTAQGVNYFINGHNHNPAENPFAAATQITIGAPSKNVYYDLTISPAGVSHQKMGF